MAYEYGEFWIVVGTAAPVLLVSSVVAIGQSFDLAVDEGVADAPPRVQDGPRLRLQPILKAAFASGVSVLADFVALLFALIDLAARRNVVPLWGGIVALAIAVVALLITLLFALEARTRVRRAAVPPHHLRP
jgi:hypothetical protein